MCKCKSDQQSKLQCVCSDCKPKIDWSKPIRYVNKSHKEKFQIIGVHSIRDSERQVVVGYNPTLGSTAGTYSPDGTSPMGSQQIENVPEPKKKVTVVTLKSISSGNVILRTKEEAERGAYKTWIVLKSEDFEV